MIHRAGFPPWVNWIAQDADGSWWGHSVEPLRHDRGWYENEVGDCIRLGAGTADGWRESLRRVDLNAQLLTRRG